jgi:hypothetical protein
MSKKPKSLIMLGTGGSAGTEGTGMITRMTEVTVTKETKAPQNLTAAKALSTPGGVRILPIRVAGTAGATTITTTRTGEVLKVTATEASAGLGLTTATGGGTKMVGNTRRGTNTKTSIRPITEGLRAAEPTPTTVRVTKLVFPTLYKASSHP